MTGLKDIVSTDYYSVFDSDNITEQLLVPVEKKLNLALVTTTESRTHFILILGMDTEAKKLQYIDPNYPNMVYTTDYVVSTYQRHSTISMAWNGQFTGNGFLESLVRVYLNPKAGLLLPH